MKPGLYIVATPIGNLGDITLRALECLKSVDFIASEDTRITRRLTDFYQIKCEMISLNARTESQKINYILDRIVKGESCSLLTDAGTPCISDPGTRLVNAAHNREIEVISIPGASALTAALSISGLPTDSFIFYGFLPNKKGRQKILKEITQEKRTVVLYESTYRIIKLLKELKEFMPHRHLAVCREITKIYEEVLRGSPSEIQDILTSEKQKGEFVVVIAPSAWEWD